MKYGYTANKPALTNRLRRIEGQVRGVTKMVDADTYCIDILTQITAIQAGLDKLSLELLRDHAAHCLDKGATLPDAKQDKVDELITAIGRML